MKGNFYASRFWTKNFRKQDFNVLTLPVKGMVVPVTDPGGASGFGTALLGDFPDGVLLLLGASARLKFTTLSAGIIQTFSGAYSIGTDPTADATLTGTDGNIIASTAIAAAVAGVSAFTEGTPPTFTLAPFDNKDGTKEINLNVNIVDASITTAGSLQVDGILYLAVVHLGDD
jgi:hypothetical protein